MISRISYFECVVLMNACEIFIFFFTAFLTTGKLKSTNMIDIHVMVLYMTLL